MMASSELLRELFEQASGLSAEKAEELIAAQLPEIQQELRAHLAAGNADDSSFRYASTVVGHVPDASEVSADLPERIGRYRVRKVISSGGMGVVFLAEHPHLTEIAPDGELIPQRVAIKVSRRRTNSEEQEALRREATVLCTLDHPHIARIQDLDFEDGFPHLVMEYVAGGSLRHRISSSPMEIPCAVTLISRVARAIHYAHEFQIFHRDLKPENILLAPNGEPRIIDFGLASLRSVLPDGSPPGGTIRYMAPEQASAAYDSYVDPRETRAEFPEDARADVFSLAAILYELLTEKPLYEFDSTEEGLRLAMTGRFDSSALNRDGVSRRVRRACLKALATDRTDRFRSAREFADAIDPPLSRRLWPTAVMTAVALIVIFVCRPYFNSADRSDPNSESGGSRSGQSAAVTLATAESIQEDDIKLTHFVNDDRTSRGEPLFQNGPTRVDDDLRVDATFSKPTYCFLVAINPDGEIQLCFPATASTVQTNPINELHFPEDSKQGFGFTDGTGQQAFLLIWSVTPLPSFSDWKQKLDPWPSLHQGASGRWFWRNGRLEPWSERGETRGTIRDLKGSESFVSMCTQLQKISPGIEIYGVSFPIETR